MKSLYQVRPLVALLFASLLFPACDSNNNKDNNLQKPPVLVVTETTADNPTVQQAINSTAVSNLSDELADAGLHVDASASAPAIIIPATSSQGQAVETVVSTILLNAAGQEAAVMSTLQGAGEAIVSQPNTSAREVVQSDDSGNEVTFKFNADGGYQSMSRTTVGSGGGFWTSGTVSAVSEEVNRDHSLIDDIQITTSTGVTTVKALLQQGFASGKTAQFEGLFLGLAGLAAGIPIILAGASSPG